MTVQAIMLAEYGTPVSAHPYADAVRADAPISYWRFTEQSGTTAVAEGSNPVNGTYANVGGIILAQQSLSGDSDDLSYCQNNPSNSSGTYVNVGASTPLNLSRNFTIEALFLLTSTNRYQGVIAELDGGYEMRVNTNQCMTFEKTGYSTIGTSNTVLSANVRNHCAITMDGSGNWAMYVNGVRDISGNTSTTFFGNNGLAIGQSAYDQCLDGFIDEVAIYGSALSAARIAAHYAALH